MNNLRNKVLVLGSGGHARFFANVFECLGYDKILIIKQIEIIDSSDLIIKLIKKYFYKR
jgi:hypothetical protein